MKSFYDDNFCIQSWSFDNFCIKLCFISYEKLNPSACMIFTHPVCRKIENWSIRGPHSNVSSVCLKFDGKQAKPEILILLHLNLFKAQLGIGGYSHLEIQSTTRRRRLQIKFSIRN